MVFTEAFSEMQHLLKLLSKEHSFLTSGSPGMVCEERFVNGVIMLVRF